MSASTISGIHPVTEAIKNEQDIDKLFVQKNLNSDAIRALLSLAQEKNIPVSYVPIQKLDKLSDANHQGIVAKIAPISFQSIEELVEGAFQQTQSPLFVLLDQVSDVRNLGAIMRTAACTGVNGIILPKQGGAAINEQTVKTSTGAIFNLPICKVDHLKDAFYFLQSYQVQLIAATEKTDQLIYDIDLKKPTAIIMGSEGKGVTPALLKMADQKAKLPLLGTIDSLNVSVACGAILYESVRQRLS